MSKLREKLVDRMIRIYGYEHPKVIAFANACETAPKWQDSILEEIVYFEKKCLTTGTSSAIIDYRKNKEKEIQK